MNRRNFVKAALTATALNTYPHSHLAWADTNPIIIGDEDGWRTFEVTSTVELKEAKGISRIWIPTPLEQNTDFFRLTTTAWRGNASKAEKLIDKSGAAMISAVYSDEQELPKLSVVSTVQTRDRICSINKKPENFVPDTPAQLSLYRQASSLVPTDGIVKRTAEKICNGITGDIPRAKAIYEWIVENTFRDPKTRGCGVGNIKFMLEANALGGKCADINTLFVGLSRSIGIPARDVYGIRVADSKLGYKSLGKSGTITKAQHCRAEFYAEGYGWIAVDPADVRKVILEEKQGLTLKDDIVIQARKRLFGQWEMNWLAYNYGHDVTLRGSSKGDIPFLMYPHAETADGRKDPLAPEDFNYTITSREV
jgi:transglutaminase-like putative cysteine protease